MRKTGSHPERFFDDELIARINMSASQYASIHSLTAKPRFLLLPMLLLVWSQSSVHSQENERPPNLIFIFCDNLGYGDIEPFGSKLNKTPALNRMAREGRLLTHFCVTAGVCTPSRASLITGCYSQRVGMHDNPRDGQVLRPLSPYGLNPAEITIAEVLKQNEYATTIIGKWHLGDQLDFLPTRQGFDSFLGIPYSDDMTRDVGLRLADREGDPYNGQAWPPLPLMINEKVVDAPVDRNLLTQRYTQRALEFITANRERPFFLYLPQAMPGSTSEPFSSPDFRGRSQGGPWGDSIEELDWSTGQILDKLVELGIDSDTLVIWTSDNGAPMAQGANAAHRGTNAPLYGRGYTTSEGAFRVPTIAWWPGKIPAATQCGELCTTMDILPTFAALAGVELKHKVDGHDIAGLLTGESNHSPYEAFFYYERDQLQAVRSGPWKLFVPLEQFTRHPHFKPGQANQPLLFHVVDDVACQRNVAEEHPDTVARLLALAAQARDDLGDRGRKGSGQRPPGKISGIPTARVLH